MADIKPKETYYNGYRFRSRLEARWAVFFDALGVEYEYEPEGFILPSGACYLPDFRVKCHGTRGDCFDESFDLWIEVKGRMTCSDMEKIKEFVFGCKISDQYAPIRITDCPLGYGKAPQSLDLSPHSDYDDHERRWTCQCGAAACKLSEDLPTSIVCPDMIHEAYFEYPSIRNRVLILGNIPPNGCVYDSGSFHSYVQMDGCDIYPFNYELIDGDHFAAYPAADQYGRFYLFGDDSNYVNKEDIERIVAAYNVARTARFEHGETPTFERR